MGLEWVPIRVGLKPYSTNSTRITRTILIIREFMEVPARRIISLRMDVNVCWVSGDFLISLLVN